MSMFEYVFMLRQVSTCILRFEFRLFNHYAIIYLVHYVYERKRATANLKVYKKMNCMLLFFIIIVFIYFHLNDYLILYRREMKYISMRV